MLFRGASFASAIGYSLNSTKCNETETNPWVRTLGAGLAGVALGAVAVIGAQSTQGLRADAAAYTQFRDAMLPKRIVLVRHAASEGNADVTLYRTKPDNSIDITCEPDPRFVASYGEAKVK